MAGAPDIFSTGEYGATTVALSRDGSALRIAFGRNGDNGPLFYAAVLLTDDAVAELKRQMAELGI